MAIKSPIHYMGNKFKLIEQIKPHFPNKEECNTFIDLFGGSGCVSLNVDYDNIIYNELNENMVDLLKIFKEHTADEIIEHIWNRVKEFNLPTDSCDIRKNGSNSKRDKANKAFNRFRKFYNESDKNKLDLYTLTFFSFCNLIRFNSNSEFNMPFGNQCFLKENEIDIKGACYMMNKKNITFSNKDAFEILSKINENNAKGIFIYCDPPYTSTMAIYNENGAFGGWSIDDDNKLFNELDRVGELGVKWCLSNVLENKGKVNEHIKKWADDNKYKILYLDREYASLGKGKANSVEVLIMNYDPSYEQTTIFDFIEDTTI